MKFIRQIDGKQITFRYFLNRNLRADYKNRYSIYILIIFNRKNTKLRSGILKRFCNEKDLLKLKSQLNSEVDLLTSKLLKLYKSNDFELKKLSHKPRKTKPFNNDVVIHHFKTKYKKNITQNDVSELLKVIRYASKVYQKQLFDQLPIPNPLNQ